jgi:hypothetical protein
MQRHHLWTRRKSKTSTERICRECHKTVHGLFSHKQLRDSQSGLNSLEGLLENEQFQKALAFIRRVPPGEYMRMKQARGRRGKS